MKRKFGVTALAALLAGSLAACGTGKQGSSETKTDLSESQVQTGSDVSDSITGRDKTDKLQIYTSFYPMYYFTKEIVGDTAEVKNVMPAGSSSHDYEPSAADIASLSEADVFIYQGAGMEFWIDGVRKALEAEGSQLKFIEAAHGIEDLLLSNHYDLDGAHGEEEHVNEGEHEHELEGEHDHEGETQESDEHGHEHDHDHGEEGDGHNHGKYDPHLWLSFAKADQLLHNISSELSELYPENAATYEANYKAAAADLKQVKDEYAAKIKDFGLKTFIVNHAAFGYLAEEFGLRQVGISGVGAEQEPSPALMTEIIAYAKENKVGVIFYDKEGSDKVAKVLAGEVGAEVMSLDTIHSPAEESIKNGIDYLSLMKENLDNLLASVKK